MVWYRWTERDVGCWVLLTVCCIGYAHLYLSSSSWLVDEEWGMVDCASLWCMWEREHWGVDIWMCGTSGAWTLESVALVYVELWEYHLV